MRTPFILDNMIYFAGNMFAGLAVRLPVATGPLSGLNGFHEVAPLISIFYIIQILLFVSMAVAPATSRR